MLSLNQIKLITALSIKKHRQEQGRFVVEGEKMVAELLQQSSITTVGVYGLETWAQANASLIEPLGAAFQVITAAELKKISSLTTPNAVLAVAAIPQVLPEAGVAADQLCFYLDGIQDPGNLGAILRIADWFGHPAVFCSPDCVDVYNSKVVQSSMGAVFRVGCREIALEQLLKQRPGLEVAGAVLHGENVFETPMPAAGLLVIGNEGRGISAQAAQLLTRRLSIPRHPDGGAESLNAAVAAGILAALCYGGRSVGPVRR